MIRCAAVVMLVAAMPCSGAAQEMLASGTNIAGTIPQGATREFHLKLDAGDYVSATVTQNEGAAVTVILYRPDGAVLRRSPAATGPGAREVAFVAEEDGLHRLALCGGSCGGSTTSERPAAFSLTVNRVIPVDERLQADGAADQFPSPRLLRVRAEAAAGTLDVDAFWAAVAREGTPMVEPFADDPRFQLVTFLWRGGRHTRNVLVLGTMQGHIPQQNMLMRRVPNTSIWYLTLRIQAGGRFTYQLSPNDPLVFAGPRVAEREATAQSDPFNRNRFGCAPTASRYACESAVELPGARAQPWFSPPITSGRTETFQVPSVIQQLERTVTVHTPADYRRDAEPYPLLVLFDGPLYATQEMSVLATLSNLAQARRIPPLVTVLVSNVEGRRAEDLSANPAFADFVATELVPWVRARYNVTTQPARTIAGGFSAGGLAAAYLGLRHAGTFGNVLSQSGAFWWAPSFAGTALEEQNWLAQEFARQPKQPVRFYLDAGTFEAPNGPEEMRILVAARHFRDVLRAKGYEVHYQQFAGGHDPLSWRGTLADGLIALIGIP